MAFCWSTLVVVAKDILRTMRPENVSIAVIDLELNIAANVALITTLQRVFVMSVMPRWLIQTKSSRKH